LLMHCSLPRVDLAQARCVASNQIALTMAQQM